MLVNQGRNLVDYYVEVARACGDGKLASNWVQQDVLRTLGERRIGIAEFDVSAVALAELLKLVKQGKLITTRAREVLAEMLASGKSAEQAMAAIGIEEVDESALEQLCRALLEASPKIVAQIREGKAKAVGALIGQAKKKNPNVNPGRVREICLNMIENER